MEQEWETKGYSKLSVGRASATSISTFRLFGCSGFIIFKPQGFDEKGKTRKRLFPYFRTFQITPKVSQRCRKQTKLKGFSSSKMDARKNEPLLNR